MPREHTEAVRCLKLKIVGYDGDFEQAKKEWLELSIACQQMTNLIWQTWLVWHVENNSAEKIRSFLTEEKGKRKKWPVEAVSPALAKHLRKTIIDAFPAVHGRIADLLLNKTVQGIKKRKSANSKLSGWVSILLLNEALPSFTNHVPIPFDVKSSDKGSPIQFKDRKPQVAIRLHKTGKVSSVERFTLAYQGRNVGSQVAIAQKIADGEYKFCGSSLFKDSFDHKWYVSLSYRRAMTQAEGLDSSRSLTLFPSVFVPFRAVVDGQPIDLQGDGRHIAMTRQICFETRRSYAENYRYTDAGKGRGRKKAIKLKNRERFARKWRELVKRVNHNVSHAAVDICVKRGLGELIFASPKGKHISTRLVSRLGSTGRDQSSWEFFQLKTLLSQKCQAAGIKFREVAFGKE